MLKQRGPLLIFLLVLGLDLASSAGFSIISDHLDVSNYEEVAEYYGFGGVQ